MRRSKFQFMMRACKSDLYFTYLSMSDQFNFEEEQPLDWLKEASQFTENHHSLYSDLSKDHFLDELLKPQQPHSLHPNPFTAHQRQRSKANSKNYRDRRKMQIEHMKKEVELLQKQNEALKSRKYCRWCKRPYSHPVLFSEQTLVHSELEKAPTFVSKEENYNLEAEFQKPDLIGQKKVDRRGKIWIALGILMLVLGVTLYGFQGDKSTVKEIEIYRDQMSRWTEQLQTKEEEYFQVNMRIREDKSMDKMDPGQLKIIYKTQPSGKSRSFEEDKVSINKELLYGIHAELDDIGVYL